MEFSLGLSTTQPGIHLGAEGLSVPIALGALPSLLLEVDVEMSPRSLAADFSGSNLTFGLATQSAPLPAGLSLSVAGILSGTPTEITVSNTIVIEAVNSEGSATSQFQLTIQEMILDFLPTLTGLTVNATYGSCAESGIALTAGGSMYTGATPTLISYQWATLESGPIAGATGASFTPNAGLYDNERLICTVMPEGYPARETQAVFIRHAPPTAAGNLWDDIIELGSDPELYDIKGDFSGENLIFSVTGPGCTIDSALGLLTINPSSPLAGATVTVTAQNSGGAVSSAFTLTVEGAGDGVGPALAQPLLDPVANTIDLNVDVASIIYWRRDQSGTNPTADMVIAGGGFDSGSFAVAAGSNAADITFGLGNDGIQEISFVAAITPTEPSLVQTLAIDIDTTAPELVASIPAAGAGAVALNSAIVLEFSEPVQTGTGTVSLYNVTAAASVDDFDITVAQGNGAGQFEVLAERLTLHPSAPLLANNTYAILIDDGAISDLAGNSFVGIVSTNELSFIAVQPAVLDTEFAEPFATEEAAIWSSIQANTINATPEHRGSETWGAFTGSTSTGGIVGVKDGSYPQLRFMVSVEVGKTYEIDADFPIGEGSWLGPLRVKLGSSINQSDYAQIDEAELGQPRIFALRGQQFVATTAELWMAVITETNTGGAPGGNPAISMLRVKEI